MKRKPKKPISTSIRKSWGINPVQKVKDSKKIYKRKKKDYGKEE